MEHRQKDDILKLLDTALDQSTFAWWEWDIPENHVFCNDLKLTMLGYDPADFRNVGFESFTGLLHPDDYERTMQAMRAYLNGSAPIYQTDYRIRKMDGDYTWYMDRGLTIEKTSDGLPLRLRGLVIDLGLAESLDALDNRRVDTIRRALPPVDMDSRVAVICSVCKRLKIGENSWVDITENLAEAFPAELSHGICRECMHTLYPELAGM